MRRAGSSSDSTAHSSAGADVEADPDVFSPGQDKKEKAPSSASGNPGNSFSFSNYWGQAASFLENVGEVVTSVGDYVAPLPEDELDESREEEDGAGSPTGERGYGNEDGQEEEEEEGGGRGSFYHAGSASSSSSYKGSGSGHHHAPASASAPVVPVAAQKHAAPAPQAGRGSPPPQSLQAPQYDLRFTAASPPPPAAPPAPPAAPLATAAAAAGGLQVDAEAQDLRDVSLGSPEKSPQGRRASQSVEVRFHSSLFHSQRVWCGVVRFVHACVHVE